MAKNTDLADALGFTWDRSAVPRNVTGNDVRRALFRFRQMLAGYVFDAANLEGNPYTYPEVKTLLEGITVGGTKLSDQKQILRLAASAEEMMGLVGAGRFRIDKPTSDSLHGLVATGEAIEAGHFRGEGSMLSPVAVYLGGNKGAYRPPPTERGGANLRRIFDRGTSAIAVMGGSVFEQGAAYFLFAALMQFYYDGNKRTGRNMMNGHLMSHGIDAISVPARRKEEFNTEMTEFYSGKDGTRMFTFLASCWEEFQ